MRKAMWIGFRNALTCVVLATLLVHPAWADLTESAALERAFSRDFWLARLDALQLRAESEPESAAPASIELARRDWRNRIRTRFHSLLAAQERLAVATGRLERLQDLAEMVEQRFNVGVSTELEIRRVEQELVVTRSTVSRASAARDEESYRLFNLIGGDPEPVSGALLPAPVGEVWAEPLVLEHPRLRQLAAEIESTRLATTAVRRLAAEYPLFGPRADRTGLADARLEELRAQHSLAAAELVGDFQAARARARTHHEAASRLEPAVDTNRSLLRTFTRAYEDGEVTLLQLMDMHRADFETRRELVEHSFLAREAHIRLQYLSGQAGSGD